MATIYEFVNMCPFMCNNYFVEELYKITGYYYYDGLKFLGIEYIFKMMVNHSCRTMGAYPRSYLQVINDNTLGLLSYIESAPENVMDVFKYINLSGSDKEQILKYIPIVQSTYLEIL